MIRSHVSTFESAFVAWLRLNTNFGAITKDATSRIPSVMTNVRGMRTPLGDGVKQQIESCAWPGPPDYDVAHTNTFFIEFLQEDTSGLAT